MRASGRGRAGTLSPHGRGSGGSRVHTALPSRQLLPARTRGSPCPSPAPSGPTPTCAAPPALLRPPPAPSPRAASPGGVRGVGGLSAGRAGAGARGRSASGARLAGNRLGPVGRLVSDLPPPPRSSADAVSSRVLRKSLFFNE